jgi:hypothetical protein
LRRRRTKILESGPKPADLKKTPLFVTAPRDSPVQEQRFAHPL